MSLKFLHDVDINGHITPAADNAYDIGSTSSLDFRTLYIREIDIYNQRFRLDYTGTIARLQDHSSVGDGFQFLHLGTEILRLGNGSSTTATFAGDVTVNGGDIYLALSGSTQRAVSSTGTNSMQIGDAGTQMLRFKNAAGISLDIAANGNTTFAGDVAISSTMPKLTFTDLQQDDWRIMNDNGDFRFTNIDGSGHALVFANNNNATFAGDVTVSGGTLNLGNDVSIFDDGVNIIRTDDIFHANNDIHVGGAGKLFDRANTSNYIELADTIGISSNTNVSGSLTATSLDINGAADISGNLVLGSYTVALQGNQNAFGKISSFANSGAENLYLGIKNASYPNRGWAFNPVTNGVNSNLIIKEHGSSGDRIKIHTGGNFEVLTGSVTATGLDINGNADISGTIGSGAITSTGKIQGTELEGTSLDINGQGQVDFQTISTSGNGTVVRGGFLNPAAEASMVHIPHLVNDLAGFQKWSNSTITVSGLYKTRSGSNGSYTYSNPVVSSDFDGGQAFDAHSSTAGSWYSDNGVDNSTAGVGVITLEWTNELQYSAWAGIVFGSGSFTAPRVKIEAYRGGAWQTLCNITDNNQNVVLRQIASNSGTGNATTKLRYTLGGSVNGSYFRIHTLYAANYRAGDNSLNGTSTAHTQGVNFLERYKDGYLHGSLYPGANNTYDLGSTSYQWRNIYVDGFIDMGTNQFTDTNVGNWNSAYTHSGSAHAPSNAEQNVQSDWNASSGDALILNKPNIPSWLPSSNPNYLTGTETIVAPASITLTVVDDTINVTFAASTTSNIDNYLIFSSVDGGDYGLISIVPPDDMASSMSIIDNSFDVTGTQAYRIYAVKNGNYSSPRTGSISYSAGTVEPLNMSVVNLNKAYYIQWNTPSTKSRFVTAYNVYKHQHATASSLAEGSATLIYSGMNTNFMYPISGNSNDFHKFWITTTIA